MRRFIFSTLLVSCFFLISSCLSTSAAKTQKTNVKYKITISSTISNPFVQSAWFSYIGHIKADMDKFYSQNPEGEYIIPFKVELDARNSMIDFYLRVQKDYKINDLYIEDLIKIRASNKLNEYVFFSFNPGNWINENNYIEENYKNWMKNNLPEHIPVTLAHIEKAE